jgi:AAA family ATP:ADP antiporter
MIAPRQPTLTAAIGGRLSGRPLHERLLSSCTQIEAGEGRALLLFFVYAFLVLVSLYIVRTLREPLLLVDATAEIKTYASAAAALALLVLVPLYGAAFRRTDRNQLVRWVTGLFIATLGALFVAKRSGVDIGFIYYVWAGVFGVTIVAQFWAHAADCFDVATGRRLFPTIMMGATLGGIAGPSAYHVLDDVLDASELMLVAIVLLVLTLPLVHRTRSSVPAERRSGVPAEQRSGRRERSEPTVDSALGGFALIARDRYLLLVALLIVLLNCVSTLGDFLLTNAVLGHVEQQLAGDPTLDKGRLIGEFYASFYLAVNVLTVVLQVFVVGRLFRWIGVSGALLVLPLLALVGYGLVAFLPVFALLRVVRVGEYAGNYSVLNTARQALFLPLSTKSKYEGKIATDTFFWRFGDLIPAVIVFVGLHWLDFAPQQFAVVNMGLSLVWLAVAVQLARRSPERPSGRGPLSLVQGAAAVLSWARIPPAPGLAARAASWVAAAVGVVALASSAPAEAAPDGQSSAQRLFDAAEALEMELVFDRGALCRNPQRAQCADSPATLVYRDAAGREQRVPVALRTRGRYRADTVQCELPALFVFFTGDTRDTLFAGESMLPLTTHCSREGEYEQYLLKEYWAYRIYEALASKSLRVRLVRMTYRDAQGRFEPIGRYAFFTEHFESFAQRHAAVVRSEEVFDPRTADAHEITTFDLFQYAIGNTDWSAVQGHNVLRVENGAGLVSPVPFDFDFSGLVDAEYASVPPELSIRSVRQRAFRGLCDPATDWDAAFAYFAARRVDVLQLADEIPLQPRQRARAVVFLEEAFATFASPERRRTLIVEKCRRGDVR